MTWTKRAVGGFKKKPSIWPNLWPGKGKVRTDWFKSQGLYLKGSWKQIFHFQEYSRIWKTCAHPASLYVTESWPGQREQSAVLRRNLLFGWTCGQEKEKSKLQQHTLYGLFQNSRLLRALKTDFQFSRVFKDFKAHRASLYVTEAWPGQKEQSAVWRRNPLLSRTCGQDKEKWELEKYTLYDDKSEQSISHW